MWRSLVAHLTGGQGVAGSNPVIPTNSLRSIPVTWVTDYSGDMGNTVGPNGFSIGSRRQVSSPKDLVDRIRFARLANTVLSVTLSLRNTG